MGGDDCSRVDPQIAVVQVLHHVVDEQILLELLLEDQDLELGLDAVEGVKVPDLEIVRQDVGPCVGQDRVILLQGFNFSLKGAVVLLDLQNLEVSVLILILASAD